MTRTIMREVLDVREYDFQRGILEGEVEVPLKGGGKEKKFYKLDMDHVRRKLKISPWWPMERIKLSLVGRKVPIPELQDHAHQMNKKVDRVPVRKRKYV